MSDLSCGLHGLNFLSDPSLHGVFGQVKFIVDLQAQPELW